MKQTDNRLISKMSQLGYELITPIREPDVNETLAEVVKSHELRYWEGFPVLVANAAKTVRFSPDTVEALLDSKEQRKNFRALMILSGSLFSFYGLKSSWWRQYEKTLSQQDKRIFQLWRNSLAHSRKIEFNDCVFDPERLKNLISVYLRSESKKSERKKNTYDDYSLEFALSKIFSPKQKELFRKKLDGLPLDKTEQEYFSRVVKKKVIAISNDQLHAMAKRLLER